MDNVAKSSEKSPRPIKKVTVHPLVLLSIIDHEKRLNTVRRLVGVLLGSSFEGIVDITNSNSYAVPFKEKYNDPSVWFLDHDYVEKMFALFKKLSAKEHIVGWYCTRSELEENDLDIHKLFYKSEGGETNMRSIIGDERAIEYKWHAVTKRSKMVFVRVPSEYAADEAEEIGVGQILRDVKETTSNTLATEFLPAHFPFSFKFPTRVSDKLTALKCLHARLNWRWFSLGLFIEGSTSTSHERLYQVQDMLNHLPDPNDSELIKALTVKTNDMMMMLFLGSLIRCVIALDNLIDNKIMNKEL